MTDEPQTVTFLFSDIEGSTRLWEQEPEKMQRALARHDAVAKASVEKHGGRVVKTTGDGIHAVFDHPVDAVTAVLRLQRALADPGATHGLVLRVRCGLHVGPHERRDGDFYGPAVNRAARIMGIAHGGQTLLSQALADLVGGRLPQDMSLRDLGRVRLRDLTGPERVYQLLHPQLRAEFPPLRSLEATPNNLAQQLNTFVGREHEMAEVKRLLAASRMLTLLGMGGIGKSRLSVQVGADVLDDHPDGVWLVELAALTDPLRVPQAVASVIGVKEEAGHSVAEALAKYVPDKQLLLILDNCEHLVHACADLTKQLLQAGARVKVLATSREVLQVAGETTYQVSTLSVPDPQKTFVLDELMRHESVRLFVDRAVASQASFRLAPGNAAAVAGICHRLDGIPLAIELAAARTRTLSVEAIASRLGDRFRLLVTGDQTVLPRQRTLRALIDWSHDLLPERECVLFRRLSVFAGGWRVEAAEGVGAGDGLERVDVLDSLANLVDKSLVVMELGGERYRMLDTVRHYARERLEQAGEAAPTRSRHLAFYLACAEHARPELAGPEQGAWLARLDLERENFLSAQQWSEHAERGDELGLRLMHALRPYWLNRGDLTIGLRMAVEVLERSGLRPRDAARCMALFGAGQMSLYMGCHQEARAYLTECLSIARETNNLEVVARVLQPLGATSRAQRDFSAARAYLDEALVLARELGNPRELAAALNALAMLHRMQDRLDLAEPICESVVDLARALGDKESIGIGLLNLAMVLIGRGSQARAGAMLVEVTHLAEQTGSQQLGQGALDVCAGLAATLRHWSRAAVFFGTAEAQREAAGLRRDPADEAFLAPLIGSSRQALSPSVFAGQSALGRDRQGQAGLAWVRDWLAGALSGP